MGTLTRKQREIQQREQSLLEHARRMLIEQGFAGLSMDRLAEATEYSKGTVYQHFCSKEDLVTALAIQSAEARSALFQRACGFVGRPRERMLAVGVADELFVRLHPHHFHSELVIELADLGDRATPERRATLQKLESDCITRLVGLVQDSIDAGDLELPADLQPADLVSVLWGLSLGYHLVMQNHRPLLAQHGVTAPFRIMRMHLDRLADGYDWRPLSRDWDYTATYRRITREVFADECLRAGLD